MKTKNKVILSTILSCAFIISFVFAMLLLLPKTSSHAVAVYQISNGDQLKAWLQDADYVQSNNPEAELTANITLDWGNTCAPNDAYIRSGKVLDGKNFQITLAGVKGTIGANPNISSNFSFFGRWHDGTIKNTNFVTGDDFQITIHSDSCRDNTGVFTGLIFSQINNGVVSNCNFEIKHSIRWVNGASTMRASNHFGVIAGEIVGSTRIEYTSIKQFAESTIHVEADNPLAVAFIRAGLVCSDSNKSDNGTPIIKNIIIERWGKIELKTADTNYATTGGIYGAIVADMQRSGDGTNHDVQIDGVIYNGLGGGLNNNVSYIGKGSGSGYLIGRREDKVKVYKNFYSYVSLDNESSLRTDGGVTYIPVDCTLSFDPDNENNVILTSNIAKGNEFIWNVSYDKANQLLNTYTNVSKSVSIAKHDADSSLPVENMSISLGTIKTSAKFGFVNSEVTYNGQEFPARFDVQGEVITTGFDAKFENHKDAITTTGKKASVLPLYNEREDGIFLRDNKYFIYKDNITYEFSEMTIQPAPLSLIYTEGDIYTNSLKIEGLVNDEVVTIEGAGYGNETINLNCLRNSTHKTIEFNDNTIQTNYKITKENIDDNFTYVITPHEIIVDEGIVINGVESTFASFENGKLSIYTKSYQTLRLSFTQTDGYLNRAKFITTNGIDYDILGSFNEQTETMSYDVKPKNQDDFQYLTQISLVESYKKVAVKLDISDISLLSLLSVNGQTPIEFGEYFVSSFDYKQEVKLNVALNQDVAQNYDIKVFVGGEEVSISSEGYQFLAIGDINNILNVKIDITAKTV